MSKKRSITKKKKKKIYLYRYILNELKKTTTLIYNVTCSIHFASPKSQTKKKIHQQRKQNKNGYQKKKKYIVIHYNNI